MRVGLVLLAVMSTSLGACQGPVESPLKATPIVFVYYPGDSIIRADLYETGEDGGALQAVAELPDLVESDPAWSPDGSRIAFSSWILVDGGFNPDSVGIFMINADGTGLQRLSRTPGRSLRPAWSPDGSRIAFWYQADPFDWGLATMNADGTQFARIPNTAGAVQSPPAWSPDGQLLAFAKFDGIWTLGPDGSNPQLLTANGCSGTPSYPKWSPDGTQLAFRGCTPSGPAIVLISATGSDRRELLAGQGTSIGTSIAWSPDGKSMIFDGRGPAGAGHAHLMKLQIDTGTVTDITQSYPGAAAYPDWRRR